MCINRETREKKCAYKGVERETACIVISKNREYRECRMRFKN